MYTSEVKKAICKETSENVGATHSSPEERQAKTKFVVLVEIAQV
jgi:hypothetical protein